MLDGNQAHARLSCPSKFACPDCHISYPAPEPRTFSFNSPMGACPDLRRPGHRIPQREETTEEEADEEAPEALADPREITPDNSPCPDCHGARLRKESLHFKIQRAEISPSSAGFRSTDLAGVLRALSVSRSASA